MGRTLSRSEDACRELSYDSAPFSNPEHQMTIRTRFAPSPTGYLHVGGARTALFNYLYARGHGGVFILRIEDTDRERSDEASVAAILDGMRWLELDFDEGPFYQSERMDRYRDAVARLLDSGQAYPCYCSKEELEAVRAAQRESGQKPRYDGRCRDRSDPAPAGIEPVVRFRNPLAGAVTWDDGVKGPIEIANSELDDLVIARADGTPTYNLTVVVDDIDMRITDVVRGDDHVNNTPRQINLYRALDAEPPRFAHVPMILGEDGARLSKRHGAVSVLSYRDQGFLPGALLNYLVRLGWSHGDQEVFTRREMIDLFTLSGVNRSPASFSLDKLTWLNHQYLQTLPAAAVAPHLDWHLRRRGIDPASGPEPAAVIALLRERTPTLAEMAAQAEFLYRDFGAFDEDAARKHLKAGAAGPLEHLRAALALAEPWEAEALQGAIQRVLDELGIGFGKLGQPLRVALTGRAGGPPNDQVLALLGREVSMSRIDRALEFIGSRAAARADG